jgi:hypothetical protein
MHASSKVLADLRELPQVQTTLYISTKPLL